MSKVGRSVVEITTDEGLGSGIVYDDDGHIVTNDHVVGSVKEFRVSLADGATVPARLTGAYPADDLAVIQVEGKQHLRPAQFQTKSPRTGAIVLAVGNPLGLQGSVTDGIVSATGRTLTEPQTADSPGATLPDTIQTSAAINPGNSGGALVDLSGQVIGIPTLAAESQQGGGAAPGIGFAIPSRIVTNIAGQIIKHGKVIHSDRAALGISATSAVDPATDQPIGVSVVKVEPGGAADKAGIKSGDVVTAVNGTKTPDLETLSQTLARLKPGQTVKVTVTQPSGSSKTVPVKLGQLPGG